MNGYPRSEKVFLQSQVPIQEAHYGTSWFCWQTPSVWKAGEIVEYYMKGKTGRYVKPSFPCYDMVVSLPKETVTVKGTWFDFGGRDAFLLPDKWTL